MVFIFPRKTGKVELLGGEMEGPPEDSSGLPNTGNFGFQDLFDLKAENPKKYEECVREAGSKALNWKDR